MLRRLWKLVPLAVLAAAWLLSAGVVRLMEAPRQPARDSSPPATPDPGPSEPRSLLAPDLAPELPSLLSTSILDDELSGPPEQSRPAASPPEPRPLAPDAGARLELRESIPSQRAAPVPEPSSALLRGGALLSLGATRPRAAPRRR